MGNFFHIPSPNGPLKLAENVAFPLISEVRLLFEKEGSGRDGYHQLNLSGRKNYISRKGARIFKMWCCSHITRELINGVSKLKRIHQIFNMKNLSRSHSTEDKVCI